MRKGNIIKKLAVLFAFIMFFTTFTPSIYAAETTEREGIKNAVRFLQESYNISEEQAEALYYDAEKAQEFYHVDSNGVISFDTKGALENNVNPKVVEEITSSFEKLAEEMKGVTITKDEVLIVAEACYGLQLLNSAQSRLYADTCHTDEFVWNLKLLVGAIVIAGLIIAIWHVPTGVGYEIAAILIGLGGDYVDKKNTGCGIYIYWSGPYKGVHSQTACYQG